jgi:hypothetical protein
MHILGFTGTSGELMVSGFDQQYIDLTRWKNRFAGVDYTAPTDREAAEQTELGEPETSSDEPANDLLDGLGGNNGTA